jgi:P-type conjugative transfer protein TrbJ
MLTSNLNQRRLLALTSLALGLLTSNVFASSGAAGGAATEVTQIMNNVQLAKSAADGALTAQNTVSQYLIQLEQYKTQLMNLQGLDPRVILATVRDTERQIANLASFKGALSRVQGSVAQQNQVYDQRFTEAKLLNLPWDQYIRRVSEDVNSGNGRAKARIEREEAVLMQVESDYAFARQKQQEIPAAVGQHQSLQLMNEQLNRLVTQNAQVITMLNSANGREKSDAEAKKANQEYNNALTMEAYRRRTEALRARQAGMTGSN